MHGAYRSCPTDERGQVLLGSSTLRASAFAFRSFSDTSARQPEAVDRYLLGRSRTGLDRSSWAGTNEPPAAAN